MNADPFLEDRSRWYVKITCGSGSFSCSGRAAADNAWDKVLTKIFPAETERELKEMFSETECIERRDFTVLHKIILGLLDKDLESELAGSTATINAVDSDGRTALALAAERGDVMSVNMLLRYGADPAPATTCGNTALHCAVCAFDPCCIQPLIDHSAQVNALTNWDQTPLIYVAAYRKDARHAQILIDAGANVNTQDLDGLDALSWTAITGNIPVSQVLLQHGAQPLLKCKTGETALAKAISMNKHDILDAILSRHADLEPDLSESAAILLSAAQSADLETMRLLQRLIRITPPEAILRADIQGADQTLRARSDFSEELLGYFHSLGRVENADANELESDDDIWHDAAE